jgi:hypothetical protein
MDPDREVLLQIAAQARKLSAALEGGESSLEWAKEKARLDALLARAPHSLAVAAETAAALHAEPEGLVPSDVGS